MRPLAALAVFIGLAALSVHAQQQPAITERLEVRLIEVDVVVTDRQGNPITGLGPDDFELFENGKRQVVSNFAAYREGDAVTPEGEPQPHARPEPRTIIFLLDEVPLRGSARARLFAGLRNLAEQTIRQDDRAQVLRWDNFSGIQTLSPMTSSRAEIIDALARAEGALRVSGGASAAHDAEMLRDLAAIEDTEGIEMIARAAAQQEMAIIRRKTAAMQRIIAGAADPNRRTALIYVSDSLPMVAGKEALMESSSPLTEAEFLTAPMLETVARTANAQGVVLYAVRPDRSIGSRDSLMAQRQSTSDPFGFTREQSLLENEVSSLSFITAQTGGTMSVGPTGIERLGERIVRDLGSYYTLAYHARSDGTDRERRIKVGAKNRAYVVRARRTIVDRSDRTRARDLLVARLFERGSGGDLDFEVTAGAARPHRRNRLIIPLELSIPVEQLRFEREGDELVAKYAVLAIAGDSIGAVTELTEESRRVVAPAGSTPAGEVTYTLDVVTDGKSRSLSVGVFDEKSGLAGTRSIALEGAIALTDDPVIEAEADAAWRDALSKAAAERKPIVAWFRPTRCLGCTRFEREVITHPAIQRRLPSVVYVTLSSTDGEMAKAWNSRQPGIAMFDRLGNLRARWIGIPDAGKLGALLDRVAAVAPHLERAASRVERFGPHDGDVDAAIALAQLGAREETRAALQSAMQHGRIETQQYGRIIGALLDASEGRTREALEALDRVIADAVTPQMAGQAWLAIGTVRRDSGATAEAVQAFQTGIEILGPDSPLGSAATATVAALQSRTSAAGVVRIVPPGEQVVSGRVRLNTVVSSADVAAVSLAIDGKEVQKLVRPRFSATLDLGRLPELRTIRAVAFDDEGKEIGRDEIIVNAGGERFWLRLVEPREGKASGRTHVTVALRSPSSRNVQRVVISWNDGQRAVLTRPPWQTAIDIPAEQMGILRAVAHLDDGRLAEDAVLLNAGGAVARADVHLIELPVTLSGWPGSEPPLLTAADIVVRERQQQREVDSISSAADTPLTVGILIDASSSMQKSLPDVQEAAIRFLERILTERDRAFVIAFDSRAQLIQAPTSDVATLAEKILSIRASGLTAVNDAIAVGLLQFAGVQGRRALVVFSDGIDRASRYRLADVAELAKRTHVPIHVIAARTSGPGVVPRPMHDRSSEWGQAYVELGRIARLTGGTAHPLQRLDDLPKIFDEIELALRFQILVFVRTDPGTRENEWRSIDLEIPLQRVTVHAPEGYYAPW